VLPTRINHQIFILSAAFFAAFAAGLGSRAVAGSVKLKRTITVCPGEPFGITGCSDNDKAWPGPDSEITVEGYEMGQAKIHFEYTTSDGIVRAGHTWVPQNFLVNTVSSTPVCLSCSMHASAANQTISSSAEIHNKAIQQHMLPNTDVFLVPPEIKSLLGQCIKPFVRDARNGYDAHILKFWSKQKPKLPRLNINDRWKDTGITRRQITVEDIRAIDGCTRTVWGETGGCHNKASNNPRDTDGHMEMSTLSIFSRALNISDYDPGQNTIYSSTNLHKDPPPYRDARRRGSEGKNLNNFEQAISNPAAYSLWNKPKKPKRGKDGKSKIPILERITCPKENEKDELWDRATELCYLAYTDPAQFDANFKWILPADKNPTSRPKVKRVANYTHDVEQDEEDWVELHGSVLYNAMTPQKAVGQMRQMDTKLCKRARLWEPGDWSPQWEVEKAEKNKRKK